jgi:hypothetical protein
LASHCTFIIVFFQTSASRDSGCTTFPPSPRTDRRKGNPRHTERKRPRKTGNNTTKQGKRHREEDKETRNPQMKAPASQSASSSPVPASKTRGRSLKKKKEEQHAIASILLPGKCLQFCKIIPQ